MVAPGADSQTPRPSQAQGRATQFLVPAPLAFSNRSFSMPTLHFSTVTRTETRALGVASHHNDAAALIAGHPSDWLAISSRGEVTQQCVEPLVAMTEGEESLLGVIPQDSRFRWLVSEVGPALACAVMPPEEAGIVLLSPAILSETRNLRSVSHGVWDLVLRLIASGKQPFSPAMTAASADSAALPAHDADLPRLAPSRPHSRLNWLRDHLQTMPLDRLSAESTSRVEQLALRAGLLQLHDFLDESHQCSQQIEHEGRDRNGDYWHAIMHRREPDYANSKYWFRSVGRHPIFPHLAKLAATALIESGSAAADRWRQRLGAPTPWDPSAFVDLCEFVERDADSELAQAAKRLQRAEQLLLLVHTARHAAL